MSLNRNPPKTKRYPVPNEIGRHIQSFLKGVPEIKGIPNASYIRPALKIMETEDVYKWIDYVFGTEDNRGSGYGNNTNGMGQVPVVNRIEQKGEYQIIHLNECIQDDVDHWDEFYGDLDRVGALWIPRASESQYRKRHQRFRQPSEGGIDYFTEPTPGCWQIQYADPLTPKRIFEYQEEYVKQAYPESYKVFYTIEMYKDTGYPEMEKRTGFIYSRKPRPKVVMTPFLPGKANRFSERDYWPNNGSNHGWNQVSNEGSNEGSGNGWNQGSNQGWNEGSGNGSR